MVIRPIWILCFLSVGYAQIKPDNFIPFGANFGDNTLARSLDSMSPPLDIAIKFPFFQTNYSRLQVSAHGVIIFGNINYPIPHAAPQPFPILNFPCVAPYWADTDLTKSLNSNVFYREVNNELVLNRISRIIKDAYPTISATRMLWGFVATWDNMPAHVLSAKRNTFQAIIATNGFHSFAIFTYHKLEWYENAWGAYPQVGLNAGDRVQFRDIEKSYSVDVTQIVNDSNVAVPGRFVFLINDMHRTTDCTSNNLQSTPFRGSMHGGYLIKLFGICFDRPSYEFRIIPEGTNQALSTIYQLQLCKTERYVTICTMPMIPEGRLQILVLDADKSVIGSTEFISFMPETNADTILANFDELNNRMFTMGARRFNLAYQMNSLTSNQLFNIFVYDYSAEYTAGLNVITNIRTRSIVLPLRSQNLSAIRNQTIEFSSIFNRATPLQNESHLVDIVFELIPSNEDSVGFSWKGTNRFVLRTFVVADRLTADYCTEWGRDETSSITSQLQREAPQCPCRVLTSWIPEQNGFTVDPACDGRRNESWNCKLQRGARGCYRRRSVNSDAGIYCCYRADGTLITNWAQGSGSIKAHYPDTLKALGVFYHFFRDMLPYYSCCGDSVEKKPACSNYFVHRPVCNNCHQTCYRPPLRPPRARGDPHFTTLNGSLLTFNGFGEYVLLQSTDGKLVIHVRLEAVQQTSIPSTDAATAITGFVIHHSGQSKIQFTLIPTLKTIELRIGGKLLDFIPLTEPEEFVSSSLIYSDEHQLIIRQTDIHSYSISYGENANVFLVDLRPQIDFLNLICILSSEFINGKSFRGLLGGYQGLTYPNGSRVFGNVNDDREMFSFGELWRVTNASSLFHYDVDDSYERHQNVSYRPIFQADLFSKYRNTSRYGMAERICQNITAKTECMFDVLVTNDSTLEQVHEIQENTVELIEEYIELVNYDIETRENLSTTAAITTTALNSRITTRTTAPALTSKYTSKQTGPVSSLNTNTYSTKVAERTTTSKANTNTVVTGTMKPTNPVKSTVVSTISSSKNMNVTPNSAISTLSLSSTLFHMLCLIYCFGNRMALA